MKPTLLLAILCLFTTALFAANNHKVILIAGATQTVDVPGHHDYLGGCRLLEHLLKQTPDISTVLVTDGWPTDESLFNQADALVFYTDGAGAQAYLQTRERIATIQKLVDAGVGIASLHQAVDYPPEFASQAGDWMGGVFNKSSSGRGHWDSKHSSFPKHSVTSGVTPWEINDGWLNGFRFRDGLKRITPLVWSGKEYRGSLAGGNADIVAWTYDRPAGGRSFSMSGLDAHSAFELAGVRQLVVNGILWSAGHKIPPKGADVATDKATIDSFLTPRTPPPPKAKK